MWVVTVFSKEENCHCCFMVLTNSSSHDEKKENLFTLFHQCGRTKKWLGKYNDYKYVPYRARGVIEWLEALMVVCYPTAIPRLLLILILFFHWLVDRLTTERKIYCCIQTLTDQRAKTKDSICVLLLCAALISAVWVSPFCTVVDVFKNFSLNLPKAPCHLWVCCAESPPLCG